MNFESTKKIDISVEKDFLCMATKAETIKSSCVNYIKILNFKLEEINLLEYRQQ